MHWGIADKRKEEKYALYRKGSFLCLSDVSIFVVLFNKKMIKLQLASHQEDYQDPGPTERISFQEIYVAC